MMTETEFKYTPGEIFSSLTEEQRVAVVEYHARNHQGCNSNQAVACLTSDFLSRPFLVNALVGAEKFAREFGEGLFEAGVLCEKADQLLEELEDVKE